MSENTPFQRLIADLDALSIEERQWPYSVQIPRARAAEFCQLEVAEWQRFALDASLEEIQRRRAAGLLALNGLEILGVELCVAEREEDDCRKLRMLDCIELGDDGFRL